MRLPLSSGSSVKRPVPVTTPTWRTPITCCGTHSVISMRSTSLIGPTLVSQKNVVPTSRVCSPIKRMATASAIQSTWRSTGSTTCQTRCGDACKSMLTRIFPMPRTVLARSIRCFAVDGDMTHTVVAKWFAGVRTPALFHLQPCLVCHGVYLFHRGISDHPSSGGAISN